MTITCRDICRLMEDIAPPRYALEGDAIGLQLGSYEREVGRLYLTLELTPASAEEALAHKPDMIIVHHSPFFKPFKRLREDEGHDRIVLALIRSEIALYTAHTNLDTVQDGVSDVLAALLGIGDVEILKPLKQGVTEAGLGRIGALREPMRLDAFTEMVAAKLGTEDVRYCGDKARMLRRVACCGGEGAFLMADAKARGADAYVTADVKHHEGVMAEEMGLALVDGGHFATENPIVPVLASRLKENLPELTIIASTVNGNPFSVV